MTIRKIKVEIEKRDEEIFSALNWNTHPVENIWTSKTNAFFVNHKRLLIGKIKNEKSSFSLTRLRSFVESFLPQIIVRGKLIKINNKKILQLEFLPGLYTTVFFVFLTISTGIIIWNLINSLTDSEIISNTIIWILSVPLIAIILTIWEIKRTKNILLTLLKLKINTPVNNSYTQ